MSAPQSSRSLSPDALEALFPPQAWLAGEDYAGRDRVDRLICADRRLAGRVRGLRDDYWVHLSPEGAACSVCRTACRHAAAVAHAWIRTPAAFVDVGALAEAFLREGNPIPLAEGLLQNDVLETLVSFTEGLFIPPFEPAEDLERFARLPGDAKPEILARLLVRAGPGLFAAALARSSDAPFQPVSRLALEADGERLQALSLWIGGRATEESRDAFLDAVLAAYHDLRSRGRDPSAVLRRAATVLSALPGGEAPLAWLGEAVAEAPLDLDIARFFDAAGRWRQALLAVDRGLIRASGAVRQALLQEAVAIASREGSPREGAYRLEALRSGDASQVPVLAERFAPLFEGEAHAILEATDESHPEVSAEIALALGDTDRALVIAKGAPLPYGLLRRLWAAAKDRGENPATWNAGALKGRERRRWEALCRRVSEERPGGRRTSSKT